jgi:hypothetical protein
MTTSRRWVGRWLVGAMVMTAVTTPGEAQTSEPATVDAAQVLKTPPPGLWLNGIHFSAQFDAGFNLNPMRPANGLNFGQLLTDRANQAMLNQVLLTANKPLDPNSQDFQWGFKFQVLYGSDARVVQFLGELNNIAAGERYQFAIVEANALFHMPVLTVGGVDVKIGQYVSPLGYETTDPSTDPFYSRSYIAQFGLPSGHTGVLTTTHLNDVVDLYAGVDTGANTTFGPMGDNNGAIGGIGGVNLTLMSGSLTILGLSHVGPEQSSRVLSPAGFNANGQWRFYNDIVVTYKPSDALTLVTELSWVRDDFGVTNKPVNAFGAAQYAAYTLSDTLTLNARAEVFRDDNNFFVASFSGNNDVIRLQQGLTTIFPVIAAPGGGTTYGALTLGVTYKPAMPEPVTGLLMRPEVRWDHAFTNNAPFNQNPPAFTKNTKDNLTLAADVVITF